MIYIVCFITTAYGQRQVCVCARVCVCVRVSGAIVLATCTVSDQCFSIPMTCLSALCNES